jgi:phosphoribosylanthranilate isomerase
MAWVKICGVTTVDDALLSAGLGADAVGLNFYPPSPRCITVDTARDIVRRVPPEVLSVGVFRNESRERVVDIANTVGLRVVQLHGHENAEDTRWVAERVPALIRAFGVDDPGLVSGDHYGRHRLMVDAPSPGSGKTFDWGVLAQRLAGRPYILAGGLHPDNVATAIRGLQPWGVDVASGVEESPGRKDPAKVRRFVAAAREADPTPVDRDGPLLGLGFSSTSRSGNPGAGRPPIDGLTPVDATTDAEHGKEWT